MRRPERIAALPPDYYHILGVSRTCTQEEIRRAYRRLARLYHPDVCHEPDAEEKFKQIGEAYAVLSNPERRARYDRYGDAGLDGVPATDTGFGDFFDLFEQVFGGFGSPFGSAQPARGADLQYHLTIDLQTVLTGYDAEIEVDRQGECDRCNGSGSEPGHAPAACPDCGGAGMRTVHRRTILGVIASSSTCPTCGGRGARITHPCAQCRGSGVTRSTQKVLVEVPPGISNGQRIRLPGQGDVPAGGGVPGDLYVHVTVKPDPRFERRDRDLLMRLDISFSQAALGDVVTVPTLEGERELTIPPGTQSGQALLLRGMGLPPLHGGPRGDQIVILRVVTPKNLSERERELFLELARERGQQVRAQVPGKGILGRIREAITGEG